VLVVTGESVQKLIFPLVASVLIIQKLIVCINLGDARREIKLLREIIMVFKICDVITTVCKQPYNCQYCENGFIYTEKMSMKDGFENKSVEAMIDES
jgi:hypothetical protein